MFLLFFLVVDSPIIITEVMSNVKGSEQTCGDRNEYVEIYNQTPDTIDLSPYFIYDFDAPPDTICPWLNDSILIKYPSVRINSTLIYPYTYALILDSEYAKPDTTGGNWQPYAIPDSTLILTTDETTIGDGLQNNDPLIIFSEVNACTTSFGTPYDTLDNFPSDPGDGISWERIDLALPDTITNWHPSIDTSGCTPGYENSTTIAFDLAVEEQSIIFTPAVAKIGEDVSIEVRVKNYGLRTTGGYSLYIFDDINDNGIIDTDELLTNLYGAAVNAFDSVSLYYTYKHPAQGTHNLGFELDFPYDRNLENNLVFKELQIVGEIGELALSPQIFSPNNDGIDDRLQIDYRLPASGGELTISIYDTRGKAVHHIFKKETCSVDQGTIYWDGESQGRKIPTGMYVVYLEYRYHNQIKKAKKTTVLAR